jgi:transcriptional regulator with PAS, ATPase and Fis domain
MGRSPKSSGRDRQARKIAGKLFHFDVHSENSAAAVARGVRMGRKRLLSTQQVAHARKLIEQGEGHDDVAKSLNVSRRTLYRALAAPNPC